MIATFLFLSDFSGQREVYNANLMSLKNSKSTIMTSCYRSPDASAFITDGGLLLEPAAVTLRPGGSISLRETSERNFKLPDIPRLDWAFIVKIIFSLYVILLSFEAVSGEKERGTLGLIMANTVSRSSVLIGKYISIMAAGLLPLILGMLISQVILSLLAPSLLQGIIITRVLLFLLTAAVFLSVFTFLGLLISSLFKRSALVLLVLLSVWIFFAFIIPNLSGIIADKMADIPSERETAKQIGPMIQQEVWKRIAAVIERANKGEFTTKEEILKETDAAFEEGQARVRQYYENFRNAMRQRQYFARNLSRISPVALFQFASEAIADSGPERQQRFLADIHNYSQGYDDYIRRKLGEVVAPSVYSFSTSMNFKGEHVNIQSPEPREYDGDKADFPLFTESGISPLGNLRAGLLDIGGLLVWNLLLSMLAFIAISKYDVR